MVIRQNGKEGMGLIPISLWLGLLATWGSPLLGAAPGKAFQEVRAALVAEHDLDGNGRLDSAEREAMRQAAKRRAQGQGRGRGRRGFRPPPEWIERYDTNGDGELDRGEQSAAFTGEQERMRKQYDSDGSGHLDPSEKSALKSDFEKGKFEGFDRFIAMQVGGIQRGRRGRFGGGTSEGQARWLEFDRDGDGKASREELDLIRKSNP